MKKEEYQGKKKTNVALCVLMIGFVILFRIYDRFGKEQQEKYDAAYENSMKFSQDMREFGWGFIDSENATLSYDVPNGYAYSEQNSTDNSKMFISADGSRVICVSFTETDKKYMEADIDRLISNNMDSDYTKSVESYRNYEFYVYRYSGNSENKNGGKPVQVSTYVSVPEGYMICVDDITYGEESNPKDITKLLNSMYFYETSKN